MKNMKLTYRGRAYIKPEYSSTQNVFLNTKTPGSRLQGFYRFSHQFIPRFIRFYLEKLAIKYQYESFFEGRK